MRVFSYVLSLIFIVFALVQFNDPDSWIWITAYLIPAFVALTFTHNPPKNSYLLVGAIAYLIFAIALFPPSLNDWISAEEEAKSLGMTLPGIEEARESMGLFVCFTSILFFWFKGRKKI